MPGGGPVGVEAEIRVVQGAGPMHSLTLSAPEVARRAVPGQFLTVAIPGSVVRRPFWIAAASGRELRIVFFVGGAATSWLAARPEGARLDVLGPLGSGFPLPEEPAICLLVGEGPAAALRPLAVTLRERGCRVEVLLSARNALRLAEAHHDDAQPPLVGPSTVIVTRDGSHGCRGEIADVVDEVMADVRPSVVYTAGRPAVMEAVAAAAARVDRPCYVALQRLMACAIGVCWTCVLPIATPGGVVIARGCVDGPVHDGRQVLWDILDDPEAALATMEDGS